MRCITKKAGAALLAILIVASVLSMPNEVHGAGKKLSLNGANLTLVAGQKKDMGLLDADGNEYTTNLSKYKSSNAKVATVSEGDGCFVVTAKKAGTATITAEYNKKKYSCKVTVIKKFNLANTKGKNASDVAALKKIIKKNYKKGMSVDLNDQTAYRWNKKGRLVYIDWTELGLKGDLSLNGMTELEYVNCSTNSLSSLDVSQCNKLEFLSCAHNYSNLKSLKVGNCKDIVCITNALTNLDLSKCTDLETINCGNNQLVSLDLSNCAKLKDLRCNRNMLSSLNVGNCTELVLIDCSDNQFSSLDLDGCTKLESITCYNNVLTSLDLGNCTELTDLNCHENQLTSLDLSNCTKITNDRIWCDDDVDVKFAESAD